MENEDPATNIQPRPVPKLNTFINPSALANLKKDALTNSTNTLSPYDKIT